MTQQMMRQNTTQAQLNRPVRTRVILFALTVFASSLGPAYAREGLRETAATLDCEPVLVYDVSGHGIGGPIHQHLAVYSNGLVSYSALSITGQLADFTMVSQEVAKELNGQLIAAGALELEDLPSTAADLPLTTITVFAGSRSGAGSNSFSFYSSHRRDYLAIVQLIETFIDRTFFK